MATKPTNPKDAIGINKAPLSVVPMNVVAEIGVGMMEGALKYGRHNYRGVGVRSSVYFDATMRHLIAYWEGEDIDPDSGLNHLTKAITSLVVWRDAQLQGMYEDDRPPRAAPFYGNLNAFAEQLLVKHADKSPKHWTVADEKARDDVPPLSREDSPPVVTPGEDGEPLPGGGPGQLVFGSVGGLVGGMEVRPQDPRSPDVQARPYRPADPLAESETGGGAECFSHSGLPGRRDSVYWRDVAYTDRYAAHLPSDVGPKRDSGVD